MGSSDPVNISEKLFCLLFQKNIPRNATDAIMTAITAIIQSGTRAHKTAIIIVDRRPTFNAALSDSLANGLTSPTFRLRILRLMPTS